MTYEEILKELKKLKSHTDNGVGEHEVDVNIEVAEIDDTIESYNEKISALEAKIADQSNYQYNNENEERDLTIELLEESFENQLEVMDREDQEYKTLQDLATSIFTDYNLEIATLNVEIEAIERRLRKNEIAVRKNIGIKLTDDELLTLNLELAQKRARVQECENMKAQYVEDLRNYGELITANNRKREIVLAKQESLNKIKEHRDSKVGTIDNAKLRLDKDELASLKAGVAALNARKEYITYNPSAEIDKLIEAIEQNKVQNNEERKETEDLNAGFVAPVFDTATLEPTVEEEMVESPVAEETPIENHAEALISAYLDGNEDLLENERIFTDEFRMPDGINRGTLAIPEETSAHHLLVAENPELDAEREAEIEEANEILKEKKKTPWFRQKWAKWVLAGVAAISILLSMKACGDDTKDIDPNDFPDDDISQSQTDDGITDQNEQDFNDKYEMDDVPGVDLEPETQPETQPEVEPETQPETQPEVEPETQPETQPEVETETQPETQPEVEPETQPEVELEVETGTVELEQGESAISVEDLLNGNINEDTVIEHGDEVGKTTENLELKDYTEDGNAVVEFEKVEEPVVDPIEEPTEEKTTPSREDIIKNLEEFMGGEITFTDEGNQWIDQMSGRSRR